MHEPLARPDGDAADPPVQHVLHRDYETRGVLPLKAVGVHRYAADSRTEVLCCAYAADDHPVQLWRPGDPMPAEFMEAAHNPAWIVVAHGDHFETEIELHIMGPRYGWPEIPLERHRCTQAMSLAVALPARLGVAADALELRNRKDRAGERLMHMTSKPRRAHKDEDPTLTYWFEDPERLSRLCGYCRQDGETERELFDRLPPLLASEHSQWVLSCRINARGFCIDRELADAARQIAQAAAPEIDREFEELTGGIRISQITKLLQWLKQRGYSGKSLGRKAVEWQLERGEALDPLVRRVLELRLARISHR